MKKLKKIGILSLGVNAALVFLVLGFLEVIVALVLVKIPNAIESIFGAEVLAGISAEIAQAGFFSYAAKTLAITSVSYALSGFIIGILIAAVYNLLAKKTGGVKVEIA